VDQATVRTHDGFYLRAGFGLGYGTVNSNMDALDWDATYSGSGWLFDLLLGGTVANSVIIGGGLLLHEISDPKVELTSPGEDVMLNDTSGALGVVLLGPFVDVFFGPNSGAHVGAMLGAGSIGLEDDSENPSGGWGFAVFGGYDFWVSDQWALGVNARYMRVMAEREVFDITFKDSADTFGIMFSALYN